MLVAAVNKLGILERIAENKLLMESIYLIIGAIVILLAMAVKEKIKKILIDDTTSVNNMTKNHQDDDRLRINLTELLVTSSANRSFYSLLHNGESYSNGLGIKKLTRIREITDGSTVNTSMQCQNIRMAAMPDFTGILLNALTKPVMIKTSDLENDTFRDHLMSRSVDLVVIRSLVKHNYLIGLVGVEFCTQGDNEYVNKLKEEFDLVEFNCLADRCQAIATRKHHPWYQRWFS
jgi:hypothetical protein